MNDGAVLQHLAEVVIVALLGYLLKITSDVREVLRAINGRMGRLEEWRQAHEKQDDERHATVLKHVDRLDCSAPRNGQ